MSGNEILIVSRVIQDGCEYDVECPHCERIIGLEGDDMEEIRGEQYQCRQCDGWLEVANNARRVKEQN